jgi:deazaflavin-dependent oxidoreductase (nitroreductase family)
VTAAKSDQVGQPRPVNRLLLNTFWRVHRAMFRVTGGRIGLQRPERGDKFGMLRIHTTGRRSGKERITMLGYFEDGQNLVTLAMNGWGTSEPAWWLNLQADPAAVVELPDGTRMVRARAATGAERDRLWATFADYPGWGADIGALAAHRPSETAVVVFEPQEGTIR